MAARSCAPDHFAIRKQVEYYFSDANLARDGFLRDKIAAENGGWVGLSFINSFNRMQRMRMSADEVAAALRASATLEVDETGQRVRRRVPFAS